MNKKLIKSFLVVLGLKIYKVAEVVRDLIRIFLSMCLLILIGVVFDMVAIFTFLAWTLYISWSICYMRNRLRRWD